MAPESISGPMEMPPGPGMPPVPIDITTQLTGFVKALARFRREQEAFLNNGQGADYNTALTRYSHEQANLINAQDTLLQAFGVT